MIKKVLVLIIVFALIATAVAHENRNDGKDADPHDGDAGHGNDFRDKPHHGGGDDGEDDNGDDSGDDGGSDDGGDDGGSDDTGDGGSGTGSDTGLGTLSLSSIPSGFGGSFGSGDCYRVSVWTKQLNNETLKARALYNLNIIENEYDITIDEFIKYKCSKTGLTFYPEPLYGGGGSNVINNNIPEIQKPEQITSFTDPTQAKKKVNESLIKQIQAGAVIFILFIIGFSYLYWRFRKLGKA